MHQTIARAVPWAAEMWGREVVDVRRLRGGWTSTVVRLTSSDGAAAVLRLMTKDPWLTHAKGLLTRESDTQRRLEASGIPAPRSLALDADGSLTGSPAHLMSWLPGSLELRRRDDRLLHALARLLSTVHSHDPGPERPRTYQSWAAPTKRIVPDWARRRGVWQQAFELLEQAPPHYTGTFLHRDFHLGNILWQGEQVSGVVDWVETSWGPAELDVAHASTYLAMLHGPETASRFTSLYRELSPRSASTPGWLFWHVMDIVGYLPDPSKVAQPWRDLGLTIGDDLARDRLEQHLAGVLASCSA